jgi:hypothetical protein
MLLGSGVISAIVAGICGFYSDQEKRKRVVRRRLSWNNEGFPMKYSNKFGPSAIAKGG